MLNKMLFVGYGDDGHNNWKCLACNKWLDAGYPVFGEPDHSQVVGSGYEYKFCPCCGVKFEGVQPNIKTAMLEELYEKTGITVYKSKPFDCFDSMRRGYQRLIYRAQSIREFREQRKAYFDNEYRESVAEFLDTLEDYQCRDIRFLIPKVRKEFVIG